MNDSDNDEAMEAPVSRPIRARRRRLRRIFADVALVCFAISLGIFAGLYLTRERLASDLIESSLRDYSVPAQYDIASIGPQEQVLENIVLGDPASPDLTVDRAVVTLGYRFGTPTVGSVRLENPRLYGRWNGTRMSFGSLDSLIYEGESETPFVLPDIDLQISDGRALLRSPWGDMGAKLAGRGNLADGFVGVIGAVMPNLAAGPCAGEGASLYGQLTTRRSHVRFEGPLRLASIDCEGAGSLGATALQLRADSADFASFELNGRLQAAQISQGELRADAVSGEIALTRHAESATLVSNFDLTAEMSRAFGVAAKSLRIGGRIRTREDFSRLAFNGDFEGEGVRPGSALDGQLVQWQQSASGTMGEPLLAKIRRGLTAEGQDSKLSGEVLARLADGRVTLTVPEARWRGSSGNTLLSVSRGQYGFGADRPPQMAGNFSTGGTGLPTIVGRMEDSEDGDRRMRLTMAEFSADDASLAVPEMRISQNASGAITLSGNVLASGAFPGGEVDGLELPVAGGWTSGSGLALGFNCITPRFDALRFASLSLARQTITLCPPSDGAILRSGANGTRFAAGVPTLTLAGRIGETPVRVAGGPVGFAFSDSSDGVAVASDLDVEMGEGGSITRFVLSNLTADLGTEIRGNFANLEMRMEAVPLDITRASGQWSYVDYVLALNNAQLRVTDRAEAPRFNPMVAEGASLRLADNHITADALLREERSERRIVDVDILHDLATGIGHADLNVDALTFDKGLQPTDITDLALGTVANAEGSVEGVGRIDWSPVEVTSTGTFSTDSLDFAAAFGPVKGLAGTIRFTDLLAMVTAPDQQITIAEVNPGIPVENGVISYALESGNVFAFNSGKWPFVGGTLELRPVRLTLGADETRRYVFVIEGLDAARFLERMELANLSATGTFDGTLPVVFDKSGGHIEGGFLQARPPGGNLSYVGALTYEDMSAMANFAFDALKSMDYKGMTIGMDGNLEGEIVTRVKIDGVSQGEGASKNIITRRLASLPIRFNVNIRAPFYQLLSSLKSLYDPTAVRDPRELGLVAQDNGAFVPDPDAPSVPETPETPADALLPTEPAIQNPESETMR